MGVALFGLAVLSLVLVGLRASVSGSSAFTVVMEMAVEKPEIRFETISSLTGLETIEKLRSGSEIHI